MIEFIELGLDDIPQMHQWFNLPHIQQFYSLRNWTQDEVREKLSPYITHQKPVSGFIIYIKNSAIGYIQKYRVSDFPWDNLDLSNEVCDQAAGIDLFIGEKNFLGKGFGFRIVNQFLQDKIWNDFDYCIVDPSSDNIQAIHCYHKLGFIPYKTLKTTDALKRPTEIQIMIKKHTKE